MTSDTMRDERSTTTRLRQVDEHVALARRERSAEPVVPAAPGPGGRIVPAPRRVPVFLRRSAGQSGFAQLTITHPLPAPRRAPDAG